MIQAVCFDLDNTLQDLDTAFDKALAEAMGCVCAEFGVTVGVIGEALHRTWPPLWDEFMAGRRTEPTLYPEWFRRALNDVGMHLSESRRHRIVQDYSDAFDHHLLLYPDVPPTLRKLQEASHPAFRMAILTNGPGPRQRQRIRALGLNRYIDTWIISEELAVGKPDPGFFHHALRQLDVLPQQAVMIGDTYETDIAGASAVGMRAIWLNRSGSPPSTKHPPVPTVSNLMQAIDLIAAWNAFPP